MSMPTSLSSIFTTPDCASAPFSSSAVPATSSANSTPSNSSESKQGESKHAAAETQVARHGEGQGDADACLACTASEGGSDTFTYLERLVAGSGSSSPPSLVEFGEPVDARECKSFG
jgi:hypothetical protein